jgi:hypothetical protein
MRTKYLAAMAIAALAACTGLTVDSFRSPSPEKQSTSVTQVADRLALSVDRFLMRSGG